MMKRGWYFRGDDLSTTTTINYIYWWLYRRVVNTAVPYWWTQGQRHTNTITQRVNKILPPSRSGIPLKQPEQVLDALGKVFEAWSKGDHLPVNATNMQIIQPHNLQLLIVLVRKDGYVLYNKYVTNTASTSNKFVTLAMITTGFCYDLAFSHSVDHLSPSQLQHRALCLSPDGRTHKELDGHI